MNNKDNFWTGLIVGGLLGMTLALMINRAAVSVKEPSGQRKNEPGSDKKVTSGASVGLSAAGKSEGEYVKKGEAAEKKAGESAEKRVKLTDIGSEVEKPGEAGGKEAVEKINAGRDRETAGEDRENPGRGSQGAEKEGEGEREGITGKINFGKRIAQLEEALKGLRDEEG